MFSIGAQESCSLLIQLSFVFSCCHVGHAVSIKSRSLDDHCLLPLHVYGVGAAFICLKLIKELRGAEFQNSLIFTLSMFVLQCIWWLLCWQTVSHTEGSSMEERSILCEFRFLQQCEEAGEVGGCVCVRVRVYIYICLYMCNACMRKMM